MKIHALTTGAFVVVLTLAGCVALTPPPVPSPPLPTVASATATSAITDADKAAVARLVLDRALADWAHLLDSSRVLSTENLDPDWIPQLNDLNIMILSPEEIGVKADKEGAFRYLRLLRFETRDDGRIAVSFWLAHMDPPSTGVRETWDDRGLEMEFHRENGTWVGQVTGQIII